MNKDSDFTFWSVVSVGVLLLIYVSYHKIKPMLNARQALKKALDYYSREIVENCEKIYRLETNNFLSGQFSSSYSAGMNPAFNGKDWSLTFPYGWNSLKDFWTNNPHWAPIGVKNFMENSTGHVIPFISFDGPEGGVMTLCEILKMRGNEPGSYFSTDSAKAAEYEQKLDSINPSWTEAIG
jgi:hypothetical protein